MAAKKSVGFRLTPDQVEKVDAAASQLEMTRSELLEFAVLKFLGERPVLSLAGQLNDVLRRLDAVEQFMDRLRSMFLPGG